MDPAPYQSPVPCTCRGTVHDHLPGCPQTCSCGRGRGAWRAEPKQHKPGCILRDTDVRFYDDAVYVKGDPLAQIDRIIAKHDEAIRLLRSLRVSTIHAAVAQAKATAAARCDPRPEEPRPVEPGPDPDPDAGDR